ncbi:hypothetical protein NA57DRAFT_77673 [Rhizodiscina lignyota]|uniref:Uncharacterized protein n=1 Tax=Rhizodiscina lignyota TaxID=1504668 RepID=A0A9P4I916_9PEZI|nr:hypothetical protein NA57DRAFT_77673 [Rhizodiscina lignyota]
MRWTSFVVTLLPTAFANVEKTIFKAPPSITIPQTQPNFEHLCLHTLTPSRPTLNTDLAARFPSEQAPRGIESWHLLDDLSEGQRHELRICWAAIQPTEFWLNVYTLNEVFDAPSLVTSLAAYSEQRKERASCGSRSTLNPDTGTGNRRSLLFLRVQSAADYFTTNNTLMRNPPDVHVDIILDPYVLGIFPRSLLPTAVYLLSLTIIGWYLSGYLWSIISKPPRANTKAHKA